MKLPSLPKKHNHNYHAEMHIYIDDLKELHDLRDKAETTEEKLFYSRLIRGCQDVLEWLQGHVVGR